MRHFRQRSDDLEARLRDERPNERRVSSAGSRATHLRATIGARLGSRSRSR